MTNPNPHYQQDDTLERLEALRDQIQETYEDRYDERTEQHADYRDDDISRRSTDQEHEDNELGYGSGTHMGL